MTTIETWGGDRVGEQAFESLPDTVQLEMFWFMLLARRVDERAWVMHRQGKIAFHISGIGQEACQIAAAFAINRGVDYLAPYYRDIALVLACGVPAVEFVKSLYGKADISSGGRQMPSHFGARHLNIISTSASVATQVPHATGLAFAIKYRQSQNLQNPNDESQPRLALTCLGEGSTSQGEWHEAMNWAGVHNLPFVCLVQNNQYAISVPSEKQMATKNVADRASAYGMEGIIVDGNDLPASYNALHYAVQKAYNGGGPTLVEAKTYRITPHSSDDDDRSYRERAEVEEWKRKDPLLHYQSYLMENGILSSEKLEEYQQRAQKAVDEAVREAEAAPYPPAEAALAPVYAPFERGA